MELYKGQPGSPIAALINDISETDTEIIVSNGSYFPDPPNLATIYGGEDFETILYRSKNGNILSDITRAVEGTARAWRAGTRIARFYTAYDQESIIENIKRNQIYMSDTEPPEGYFWLDTVLKYKDSNGEWRPVAPSQKEFDNLKQEHSLKITKIEKELNDYKKTMSMVNINHEAKQKISGYGIINLPQNCAEGQINEINIFGNTETDEEGNTKSTISSTRIKSVGKNLLRNGNGENGTMYWNPLTPDSFIFNGEYFEKVGGKGTTVYSDYFKLPIGQFRLSSIGQSLIGPSFQIDLFDENEVSLGRYYHGPNLTSAGVTINLTESKNVRIRLITGATSNHFIIKQIQLEKGTVATEYESYKESNLYVLGKDEEGNILELRSLPNGTKDEIRVSENKLIKRIGEKTNVASGTVINYADMADNGTYYAWNDDGETETGVKGDTLGIDATELIYQLAMPVETPVQVSGTLVSYPSGTVYIEPYVADAGIYTDKMEVLHSDLPIKALEKISKVDFMTGVETELDINQTEISEDKLSFTHPDLSEGDIVFFEYEYDVESTEGETEVEFYDSRYVIKDSITDKFYKWNIAVENGVPSIVLEEV